MDEPKNKFYFQAELREIDRMQDWLNSNIKLFFLLS
jgi:hypothetical protein